MSTVQDILATKGPRVQSIGPEASVLDAALLMNEHKIGCLVVLDDGHVVGNHTMTHPDLCKMKDADRAAREIDDAKTTIERATGVVLAWFSTPFGVRCERVEDLPVVVARPHRVAVGDQAQAGDVVTGAQELGHRSPDPRHGQPGIEQGRHHAQRH